MQNGFYGLRTSHAPTLLTACAFRPTNSITQRIAMNKQEIIKPKALAPGQLSACLPRRVPPMKMTKFTWPSKCSKR